jgi:hypothetical protein
MQVHDNAAQLRHIIPSQLSISGTQHMCGASRLSASGRQLRRGVRQLSDSGKQLQRSGSRSHCRKITRDATSTQ